MFIKHKHVQQRRGRDIWLPADFGGTDQIPDDASFSVTCLLPPNVAINVGVMQGEEEIGN